MSIALIEDHEMLRQALAASLRAEGHQVFVPDLTSTASVVRVVLEARPQVTLLDLDLGAIGTGLALLEPLLESGTAILVVSATTDDAVVGKCLQDGAAGWVPKRAPFEDLLTAVLSLADGRESMSQVERRRLISTSVQRDTASAEAHAPFERLTQRETAVLAHLVAGRSVERIAAASFVSESTVRTQVRSILLKLGVNSQLEAVAMATRAGWQAPGH